MEMNFRNYRGLAFSFGKGECFDESPAKEGRGGGPVGLGISRANTSSQPWQEPCGGHEEHSVPQYGGFSSFQSFHPMSSNSIVKGLSVPSNAKCIQYIQNILPLEGYNWCATSDVNDAGMHVASHGTINAGSLVLDSSRGELVNALHMTPKEILEAKALAASRSHSEAERRRRERINSHLATLRSIVPGSIKSDKASLLAEVIDRMKRLKRQVLDVYQCDSLPSENDELVVEIDQVIASGKGRIRLRATLCCDDRPDLMTDLKHALNTLKLRMEKVEMSTLGGRLRNHFVVVSKDESVEHDPDVLIRQVQEALKAVMEKSGGGELLQGKFTKRQRLASQEGQIVVDR